MNLGFLGSNEKVVISAKKQICHELQRFKIQKRHFGLH